MSGLDPAAMEQVLKILVRHAGRDGTTVLFSSHQLADVDQIADHVAIVDRGRVVVDGALDDVRARVPPHSDRVRRRRARVEFKSRGVIGMRRAGTSAVPAFERGREGIVAEARALDVQVGRRAAR